MRGLALIEYVSLDGVTQAPGHAQEDTAGEFTHGGWTRPFMDDHGRYMQEALNTMGALLLGRLTYEIWASDWPTVTDPADEIARMLNTVPKYVAAQVSALKRENGKNIVVMGSSGAPQARIDRGRTRKQAVARGATEGVSPVPRPRSKESHAVNDNEIEGVMTWPLLRCWTSRV